MGEKKQGFSDGRIRRLKALIVKEFYQIIRDPSSILISLILPLILLFLYGFGVSLDADHIRLGLVLEDSSPDALSFAQSLKDSRFFDTVIVKDRRFLNDKMIEGSIRGIVVIPSYFSSFRQRPSSTAPIQVLADGSEPNTANFVQNYVQGAWQNWLQQQVISDNLQGNFLVRPQPRFWYNEELESRNFLIPGSLAIIMTLIGTLLTALVVAREWERGTMEALMSTPVGILELLIGKLVPYFILGMLSMTMCVWISVFFYHIPLRGSWHLLVLVTAVFLWTALGLGLLISTLAKNQFVAAQAAIVASFLPAFILSGFIFEIASMPLPIRLITHLIPARYFVSSLQTIFLVGNVWELILPNIGAMLIIGACIFFITAGKTVKRLD
ncbi:ABC-type transporter, permease subunit [Candidatus Protochlamydia naegleriophila]|uniref:ABC-type transporter, permease subunit n=1 Tax=Candidatus Protochlamydia naegleriophila TaxID=389348 RepID=A0A0U5JD92_9BACT|nr:ABC transporter permease [Candidatus Protochlamydia naegleriophila]CUI15750.1 ABC-type transporter, permease subunit [Candidatus Protochlamydia naegleriophila]